MSDLLPVSGMERVGTWREAVAPTGENLGLLAGRVGFHERRVRRHRRVGDLLDRTDRGLERQVRPQV
ncbi:hypothetical protein AB0D38_49030, partial [Streptomyces sp. NPDC048279]|uniref:hypothetical protein n=1 Tax=Streptomyces sp. NPDC048279 TaxID=3154714 RepID=UPI0034307F1C